MSFYQEMFPECEATAAWMQAKLRQDRPEATARTEAFWEKADERAREYIYDRVINGFNHQAATHPADRGRWPAPPYVTADFQEVWDRATAICQASADLD